MAKSMYKPEYSEAELKRRSEQAKKNHQMIDPVTGRRKFGGPQPGSGRPKKRRVTEVLNEKIEGEAENIFFELKNIMTSSKSEANKLRAIQTMLDVTVEEAKFKQQEQKDLDNMSAEDLVSLIEGGITKLSESGDLNLDFIDTEAVEIEEQPELEEGSV